MMQAASHCIDQVWIVTQPRDTLRYWRSVSTATLKKYQCNTGGSGVAYRKKGSAHLVSELLPPAPRLNFTHYCVWNTSLCLTTSTSNTKFVPAKCSYCIQRETAHEQCHFLPQGLLTFDLPINYCKGPCSRELTSSMLTAST